MVSGSIYEERNYKQLKIGPWHEDGSHPTTNFSFIININFCIDPAYSSVNYIRSNPGLKQIFD